MKKQWVVVGVLVVVVAIIGIGIGLYLGKGKEETKSPHGVGQQGLPKDLQQFSVGTSNVKAMLTDGPITWVGTSNGLIQFNTRTGNTVVFTNKNSKLLSNGIFYLTKFDNKLWVGTYGGGLSVYDGTTWKSYNIPQGLADAFVYGVVKAPNGDIWIATWSGANQIVGGNMDDPKAWRTYTVKNTNGGLPNDWVYGVATDAKGNIWLGTEGGLALYDGTTWKHWDHKDGLGAPYDKVKDALTQAADPASLSKHHARQKLEQGLERIQAPYNPNYIVSMMVDSKGRVWCGTWGGGLSVFENGKFKTFTSKEGLVGNYISLIKEGPDGTIWAGGSNGLSKYTGGWIGSKFKNYKKKDGIFGDFVFSMAFGEDKSVWIGSFGGVSWFTKGLN